MTPSPQKIPFINNCSKMTNNSKLLHIGNSKRKNGSQSKHNHHTGYPTIINKVLLGQIYFA